MGACCDNRSEVAGQKERNISSLQSKTAGKQMVLPEVDDAAERARVEEIWKQFDVDGNGYLSRDEAKAFLTVELKTLTGTDPTEDELERNFNIIDEDASGTLDKEEVLKFLKGFGLGFTLRNLMRSEVSQGAI